jgi:hypothetical protein
VGAVKVTEGETPASCQAQVGALETVAVGIVPAAKTGVSAPKPNEIPVAKIGKDRIATIFFAWKELISNFILNLRPAAFAALFLDSF